VFSTIQAKFQGICELSVSSTQKITTKNFGVNYLCQKAQKTGNSQHLNISDFETMTVLWFVFLKSQGIIREAHWISLTPTLARNYPHCRNLIGCISIFTLWKGMNKRREFIITQYCIQCTYNYTILYTVYLYIYNQHLHNWISANEECWNIPRTIGLWTVRKVVSITTCATATIYQKQEYEETLQALKPWDIT